jgi:hypothetical protein
VPSLTLVLLRAQLATGTSIGRAPVLRLPGAPLLLACTAVLQLRSLMYCYSSSVLKRTSWLLLTGCHGPTPSRCQNYMACRRGGAHSCSAEDSNMALLNQLSYDLVCAQGETHHVHLNHKPFTIRYPDLPAVALGGPRGSRRRN